MDRRSIFLRRAVTAALSLATLPALAAQESATPGERTIENVIVTAQKREQSLQDVPIVVTAVSEQLLQDTGVKDIKDLTLLTPGLIVTSSSNESFTTARIRGVGTVGDNPGLESSVGVVIDGVYRPRNGVGFGDLGEVERIEVLKGPQGTLFGKNTSAGVINVVSKKPSFDFSSNVELTAGNYSALEAAASINGPLSESVAARLYVAGRERDGFTDIDTGAGSVLEGGDGDRNYYTARGQLLLQPSTALDIRLVADYTDRQEHCCASTQAVLTPVQGVLAVLNSLQPGSVTVPADPFSRLAHSNRSTQQSIEDGGVSAEINWDMDAMGGATLTSISAYRDWDFVSGQDSDFTTVDILYRAPNGDFGTKFEQLSQELRLAGEMDRLNWLVGAFYANEDLTSRNQLLYGTQYQAYFNALFTGTPLQGVIASFPTSAWAPGLGIQDVYGQDSDTWALFTNNSYKVTDAFEVTLGLRYTEESKDLDTQYLNTHAAAGGPQGCSILRNTPPFNTVDFLTNPATASAAQTIFGIGCASYTDPIFNNLATSQSIDEGEWGGTAKLSYRFSPQAMAYVSYARGYKASGFNLDRERNGSSALNPGTPGGVSVDTDTSFNKELVDSYELGAKTQWAGNSLLLNTAVFYQDYTDFQLNTFTGIQFVVTSIPQVVSQGVDMDVVWYTPLDQLSVQGGVTYAETEIKDFGNTLGFFRTERKDDTLSFAPEWSASLSATYEQPIATSLLLRSNIGVRYTSEYNTGSNLDPRKIQDDLTLLNARIGIGSDSESWMLELWAQNLTDEEYYQVAFDATLQGSSAGATATSTINSFLGAPRTYGVTARFKF